ncbi:unnamed protein product [Fraxinus pennsylvanica]|uniref:Uncharacterized protein n=1 Tax=Fraxinus pennsylvanica TaxID=56036 RepID=A0AAD1Z6F0_9LAMI|nr:unnamed protein product [Fraxinus pennsylvanica]
MHATSVKLDITNRWKNLGSESLANHQSRSSVEDTLATRHALIHQRLDASVVLNGATNYFHQDWSDALDGELSSTSGTQGMHQEEQDFGSMMAHAPSYSNVQLPHGLVAHQLTYFPDNGLSSPSADSIEQSNGNFGCVEMSSGEVENDFWQEQEQDTGFTVSHDPGNGNYEMLQTDNTQPAKMSGLKHVPP